MRDARHNRTVGVYCGGAREHTVDQRKRHVEAIYVLDNDITGCSFKLH